METIAVKCLLARSRARLGVTSGAGHAGLGNAVEHVRGQSCRIDEIFPPALLSTTLLVIDDPTLLAYPPNAAGLDAAPRDRHRTILKSLRSAGPACLALAGVDDIPDFLIRFAERTSIFIFGSSFDEHLLISRLSGLLREKLHGRLIVQGALVNVCGRGVLITGASGVGKTTLALELAGRGHTWIADDAVEIQKRCGGRLTGRSQAMVKDLVEIKELGVLPVRDLLPAANIGDETPVDMVAEMRKDARSSCVAAPYGGWSESIIMGVKLPVLRIPWSNDRGERLEDAVNGINQAG